MKSVLFVIFASLLAAAAPARQEGGAQPEAAEAARLTSEVVRLHREGKFAEALPLARKALELNEKLRGAGNPANASALYNLGVLYFEQQKDAEAGPLLARAVAAGEKLGEPARALVIDASNKLAEISYRKGQFKETYTHLRRALDLTVAARGEADPAALPYLLNLTDLSFRRRDEAEAEYHLGRALRIIVAQPPRLDAPTAERLRRYFCLLSRENVDKEVSANLYTALERLEDPAKAREAERLAKERKERGEETDVEGGVLAGRAIAKPQPDYPIEAKQRRLAGKVVVRVLVNEAGKVVEAERLCGHPILGEAAVRAVYKWRFSPTTLNGQPVRVTGTVTVGFVLQ